ncbi:MAG TPA: hypothetical protein VLG44_06125, partial [Chlamydiales bacterium]|nr:hypothetical protein [Chlamydiales bacterium]
MAFPAYLSPTYIPRTVLSGVQSGLLAGVNFLSKHRTTIILLGSAAFYKFGEMLTESQRYVVSSALIGHSLLTLGHVVHSMYKIHREYSAARRALDEQYEADIRALNEQFEADMRALQTNMQITKVVSAFSDVLNKQFDTQIEKLMNTKDMGTEHITVTLDLIEEMESVPSNAYDIAHGPNGSKIPYLLEAGVCLQETLPRINAVYQACLKLQQNILRLGIRRIEACAQFHQRIKDRFQGQIYDDNISFMNFHENYTRERLGIHLNDYRYLKSLEVQAAAAPSKLGMVNEKIPALQRASVVIRDRSCRDDEGRWKFIGPNP